MDELALQQRLAELEQLLGVGKSAVAKGDAVCRPSSDVTAQRARFDRLRLRLKYVLFDVEASRREHRLLRQLLEADRQRR